MATEMKIPSPGESITEVEIAEWLKEDGDYVERDEPLCEVETDKATLPIPAEVSGVLKILIGEGEAANVGDVLCTIDESASGSSKAAAPAKEATPAAAEPTPAASAPATESSHAAGHPSVAAKKILDENNASASDVTGTGKGGRITKEDAAKHVQSAPAAAPSASKADAPAAAAPSVGGTREIRREKMSKLRRTIASRLVEVKNETAMLTTFNEVDMGPVMGVRSKYKDAFLKKHDVKLGFMSFFTRAAVEAFKKFPAVNAMIDEGEIVYHDYMDVGVAVSAPKGLMVPVIRNAETLSLAGVESEIIRLATRARDNKLSVDEMTGGTFSITNGGIFGSMLSTPIINPPQSAILGLHNIVERPMAVNGEVVIRPVMYVALSYDHRIIDGKEAVGFLYTIKECMEDPVRMLLEV